MTWLAPLRTGLTSAEIFVARPTNRVGVTSAADPFHAAFGRRAGKLVDSAAVPLPRSTTCRSLRLQRRHFGSAVALSGTLRNQNFCKVLIDWRRPARQPFFRNHPINSVIDAGVTRAGATDDATIAVVVRPLAILHARRCAVMMEIWFSGQATPALPAMCCRRCGCPTSWPCSWALSVIMRPAPTGCY
jgi:hypothetical protein